MINELFLIIFRFRSILFCKKNILMSLLNKQSLLLFTLSILYCQSINFSSPPKKIVEHSSNKAINQSYFKIDIPKSQFKEQVISYSGFSLMYSQTHKQPRWVAYELNSNLQLGKYGRLNKFEVDNNIKNGTANDQDFRYSGYDRGHLAPAADMSYSSKAMAESFLYSNVSPQLPSLNRGIWKNLELLVRNWGIPRKLYVVTGPVLNGDLGHLGKNRVSVPNLFYKALLGITKTDTMSIAFIIPNAKSYNEISSYVCSIDSLENLVKIDFFHQLPDQLESKVERESCFKCWNWNSSITSNLTPTNLVTSVQCIGITLTGLRCKRKTKNSTGLCFQHINQKQR